MENSASPHEQNGQQLVPSIKKLTDAASKVDKVNDVLRDLRDMKRAQIDMSTQMNQIRQENDTLFDDISWIREKMETQQTVLDKLIQFLMMMVGGRKTFLKRVLPILLEENQLLKKRTRQLEHHKTADEPMTALVTIQPPVLLLPAQAESQTLLKTLENDSPGQVKSELVEVSRDLEQDLEGIRELMETGILADLPEKVIDKLFDRESSTVPSVPASTVLSMSQANENAVRVPIANIACEALEQQNIGQQTVVSVVYNDVAEKSPGLIVDVVLQSNDKGTEQTKEKSEDDKVPESDS